MNVLNLEYKMQLLLNCMNIKKKTYFQVKNQMC